MSEEVSDAELLAEIQNDINATYLNNNSSDHNNTFSTNTSDSNAKFEGGAQLTAFQDNIITTGSDVSILLMVILLILFIIQMIRKTYKYFTLQSKIKQVANPLDSAKPIAAENLTPINPGYDHKSYPVYNTEFEGRKLYLQKQAEGAPPSILKDLLLKRAIKCIEKARVLQRDGVGIRKNWNMDLLPRDVWDDFNSAQRNIQAEVECVVQENQRLQFNWGQPHKLNIFSKAREEHERKMMIQNKVFHQKMQYQRQQQMQQRQQHQQQQLQQVPHHQQPQQASSTNAPNPKSFGNGFNAGFFNNDSKQKQKRLTKKEKQELKKQKKQMKYSSNQPTTMQNNIENPSNIPGNQQTQPRRRKAKHRFANK